MPGAIAWTAVAATTRSMGELAGIGSTAAVVTMC
jgi:hypothetical protein